MTLVRHPPEGLALSRRLSLAVTSVLHAPLAGMAGISLRRLPRLHGVPVLIGSRADPDSRVHLQTAFALLEQRAPRRYQRLRTNLVGIFLTDAPRVHGHYSRITGTCILHAPQLALDGPVATAAHLVRAATEAWLWRRGMGRSLRGEHRLLAAAHLAGERLSSRLSRANGGLTTA